MAVRGLMVVDRRQTLRAGLAGCIAAGGLLTGVRTARARGDDDFTALLARYVSARPDGVNRVDYAAWNGRAQDRATLDAYVEGLAGQTPSRIPRNRAFAYWANLYNAITLQVVLADYPLRSIRDIRSRGVGLDLRGLVGPWRTKRVTVEGRRLSLDDIEHGLLRPLTRDPRVHYAVNCASIGCPNLQRAAWRAETLDADLDRAARAYVNHPRGASFRSDGTLSVSSVYVWFKEDFGGSDAGVIAHLRRYADPPLAQRLARATRIGGHAYDWAINAA
jgi:hypothetical protein